MNGCAGGGHSLHGYVDDYRREICISNDERAASHPIKTEDAQIERPGQATERQLWATP